MNRTSLRKWLLRLAMVFVASLFFVTVDQTLRLIVGFLLSLGR